MTEDQKAQKRQRDREYYRRNRAAIIAKVKAYQETHPEQTEAHKRRSAEKLRPVRNARWHKRYREDEAFREKILVDGRQKYAENLEAERQRGARYRATHKAERYAYKKQRLATDPIFRLKEGMRNRIRMAFYTNLRLKKPSCTVKLIGCSWDEFVAYIAPQLTPQMTWSNYGTVWHVDHRTPIAAFDLSAPDDVKAAFHYTNMQPLLARDNIIKGQTTDREAIKARRRQSPRPPAELPDQPLPVPCA